MIRRASDPATDDDAAPFSTPAVPALAFATLWTTGPDPRGDRVFRASALRLVDGEWQELDEYCAAFGSGEESATRRMVREFGVQGSDLAGARAPEEVWRSLADFLGGVPTVVVGRAPFQAFATALGGGEPDRLVGLDELAELVAPGRLSSFGAGLCTQLVPMSGRPSGAVGPHELRAALGTLVGSFLELPDETVATAIHGLRETRGALAMTDPDAAQVVELGLALASHPVNVLTGVDELFPAHPALRDGRVDDACAAYPTLEHALGAAMPAWTTEGERSSPLPVEDPEPLPFPDEDARRVDEIFQHFLPQLFGGETYRAGQHGVAREVARALAGDELLLVHAPTGTGKTLAYLVPAMMWAARHDVRLGIATFTRALQEQAMDREVPLAAELLRRAGARDEARVTVLKGRQNYLCWRAFEGQLPAAGSADGATWFAWTRVALFALTDADGDLDRLGHRTQLPFGSAGETEREVARLVRQVRAQSGCCRRGTDRATCGAESARRRAERSHVVLTNHSYALARQGFFKYVVFDECEHLHDQAHSAFSHVLPVHGVRDTLRALRDPSARRPRPLDRIRRAALKGTPARDCAEECCDLHAACLDSLVLLEGALGAFGGWRDRVRSERAAQDEHSLFREYVTSEDSDDLLQAHELLAAAWNELCASLATLSEHLSDVPLRSRQRVRRALDLVRTDLEEHLAGIVAWIPRDGGQPRFRPETFYDVETDGRGRDAMAARVLLPHEYLGRFFYPELRAAVCISATTTIGGDFQAAATYLGLERAANPTAGEDREPSPYRTYDAPSPFDHERVLVAVPRDAPLFRNAGKQAFLDYVCRFVIDLASRTRGRMLVLFTNADDCVACGRRVEPALRERGVPLFCQRLEGGAKEELAERFRSRTDSVLFGLDTFWYGADFPGETLEYLVIVKLPYGVPDRYHHAQCAAIGPSAQRRSIYMPRALAKFRQGFGRLMRKETDRGCVFVLDGRVLDPRHRAFLKELPLASGFGDDAGRARLVRGDTEHCVHAALAHMGMLSDAERHRVVRDEEQAEARRRPQERMLEIGEDEVPF